MPPNEKTCGLRLTLMGRAIDMFFLRLRTVNAVVHRPTKSPNNAPKGEIPLLGAVFEISVNPTIAEEELLAEVTGLTLPQVDTWCEWHYRSGTLQKLTCYTNSPDKAFLKVAVRVAPLP